jgi:DHA1 family inner membrane transport protein
MKRSETTVVVMRRTSVEPGDPSSAGRYVLPSLAIAGAAMEPPGILTNLLLIEIGLTFGSPVGVTGQIRTTASTIGIVSALAMGVLSVRFKHKHLLTVGLFAFAISALGCAIAPSFNAVIIFYSISGLAGALVGPMTTALVGEVFSLEERSNAIGTLFAVRAFTYLVGAQIIGYIGGTWGWRIAFLGFALPVSLLSMFMAMKGLPSETNAITHDREEPGYTEGFKSVFTNRSAIACLFGTAFSAASWVGILGYSSSYFRDRFLMPRSQASILLSGAALCFMVSTYMGGRLVNKFGRKTLTQLGIILLSLFTICVTNLPNFWLALAAFLLTSVFSAVRRTAIFSLTLEQIPSFRGTMMSLNAAFYALGSALGSGIGGMALLLYGWESMGLALGAVGLAAAVIVQVLAEDPTRTKALKNSS